MHDVPQSADDPVRERRAMVRFVVLWIGFLVAVAAFASAHSPAQSPCSSPQGNAGLRLSGAVTPGGAVRLEVTGRAGAPFLVLGDDAPGPLRTRLGTLCLTSPEPVLAGVLPTAAGTPWTWRGYVPTGPALVGASGWLQASIVDPSAPNGLVALSNAVELRVTAGPVPLPRLSNAAVQRALAGRRIRFDRSLSGGAHTHVFNAAEVGKALASYTGDTRSDAALLDQIRHLLVPGNEPTATGGFQDQKQLGASLMFLLARRTPRIWNRLTAQETARVDTILRAHLASSAFTSSDDNWFKVHGGRQRMIDGDTNIWVDGNPNYRNGIVGQVLVATCFLGLDEARRFLAGYDHGAFRARLRAENLPNLVRTFDSPDPNAVAPARIEWTLRRGWVYKGHRHDELLDVYLEYTRFTYDRPVACGANPGNGGLVGSNGVLGGYMVQGCSGLPNLGVLGMLTEFDRWDGGGRRVSAHYSNDGWYANAYAHLALLVEGLWEDTPASREVLRRITVGTADLLYKIDPARGGGFHNFHHGRGYRSPYRWNDDFGHTIHASAVGDVILGFHGRRLP